MFIFCYLTCLLFKYGAGVKVEAVEGVVAARYGTFATLSVTIQSDPHPNLEEIVWYKGDLSTVVSGERFTVGGKGTELNVALTRASDYATYTCRVKGGESLCIGCADCSGNCGFCCADVTLSPTEQSTTSVSAVPSKALYTAGENIEVQFTNLDGAYSVTQITWYKGVYPITTGGRFTVSETLKKLTISTSDAGDNGVYAVVYETMRNGSPTAGIKEFTVKVLGNPKVTVTPETALVTEGSDVTFTCTAAASSDSLVYKWEKNSAVIASQTDSRLTITDAKHENAAEYKCTVSFTDNGQDYTAHSVAYLVINDDVTLEVLTPFVLADVTNSQPSLSFKVTSRSQGSVTNGKVTWYKDNSVLQEGNGITFSNSKTNLLFSNPTSANEGNYRVVVELTTLTLEGSMQLAVTSALPTVKFSETTYVGRTGEQLIVNIEVGGNPVPEVNQIEWYLNDVRLYQGDQNVRFSDNYLTLYRSKMTSAEAGQVKVAVETSAGRVEEVAEVVVIQQNDIQETKSSENQLLGKNLVLTVDFHMMPLPVEQNVQWTRDSEILTDTDPRIEFYKSGQEILIKDVTLDDAGRYTVTVNKPGGNAVNKDLLVNIRTVADKLSFTTSPPDVTVDEGSKAVISCDVSGTPSPEIKFEYTDGTQINNEGRFYVTASSLEIWAARVTDTSNYRCIADNGDQTIFEDFKVTVNQRITIKAEETSVPATIGGNAKFTVSVSPNNAKVTWTRQGVLFPESDGGHYDVEIVETYTENDVSYRKEVLTITRVQSTDLGEYEATASYSDHRYVSKVELKLTNTGTSVVSITASTRNTEVYEGENAKFTCSVSIDQSTVTWTKNGVDVTALDDSIKGRYVLAVSNQHLTIQRAEAGDEGLYMCHVTSTNSGSDQASATLTVLPPIRISEYPTHRRLLVDTGANFLLSVKVETGADTRTITWKLDDAKINGDTEMIQQSVPSSPGTRKYTVTAALSSWLDKPVSPAVADIYVTTYKADEVQEAVVIQAPKDQTAILGSTVTFECVAFGIPDPTVRWTNGSSDMDSSFFTNKYTERGVESKLVITNVKSYYQGEYRCKADNGKSSIQTKPVYMELINPPSIKLIDSVFYGVPGKELVIAVIVEYQNAVVASMTKWYRNGEPIVAEPGKIVFSNDGTAVTIVNVESASAGTYSFTIETEAGSASTSTKLEIISAYIAPTVTIPQFFTDVVAYKGSVYFLKCTVDGKPAPKVLWRKKEDEKTEEYNVHDDTLPYSVQPDSSLRIASVKETDAGTWTCVAESQPEKVKLSTEKSLTLQVVDWLYRPFVYPYHGHTSITVVSGDTLEANIEVMYRHPIRAHNIVWKRLDFGLTDWSKATELNMVDPGYDNVVSFARNRQQLMVAGISKMFEGQYRAYVKTVAGDDDTTILVYVISRVPPNIRFLDTIGDEYYTVNGEKDFVFNVNVTGEPFPKEISWYKKKGQSFEGLHNGTIDNYVYTIGYYGDMHLQRPDKSSIGYYKIQVIPEKGGEDQMQEKSIKLNVADFYLGFHTIPYVGGVKEIGTAVTMSCAVLGVPKPETVTWFKGIEKLDNREDKLIIKSIKKESKGDYYCVASNNYGVIYSPRVSLQVQYLDSEFDPITCMKKMSQDGLLTVSPCTTSSIVEGDVVTLFCNGPDGWPFPKTTWFFNDSPITNNEDGLSPAPNQYGDLVFPFAQPEDSGNYACSLTNDEGSKSNYNANYNLQVASSPDTSIDNAKTSEWLMQPGDVTVAEHTPVTIACMVSSFPEPSYEWTFNDEPMTSVPTERELSFGKRLLTFNLIDKKYAGRYSCKSWVMKNGAKTDPKEADFTLIVASRPTFVNVPIFQIGKVGDETEIDLGTPQGTPVPTIVWSFNGEGVQLGGRINVVDGRRLRIDPTLNEDQGIWQATATNQAGSAQHAIYLKIQEALEFTASPSSLTGQDAYVPQFETARFPCTVRGTPGPQIYKWYRQKHLRDPFNGLPARAYMDEDKSLVIPFTQKWDNGTYVCSVTNEYFEEIEGSVMLKVVEPPTIVTPPQDVNINTFGDQSTLSCLCEPQAVAIQSCVVDWRRDGKSIVDDQTSVKVIDYMSVLTILQTSEKHLGQYECHGSNNIGSVSAFAYITKSFTPFLTVKPPLTVTAGSKSSVSLQCHAIGFPPINYMWTFNSIPLEDSRFEVTDTGTLVIDGVVSSDTGTLTCFASNPYGQASASSTLTVEGRPIRPPAPWISSISRDNNNLYTATVKIDTSRYTSSLISSLILTLRQTESGETTTRPTSDTTVTFQNLDPKPYTVSVVVQNEYAASEASIASGSVDFADFDNILNTPVSNVGVKENNKILTWEALVGAESYKIYHSNVNTADGRTFLGSTTDTEIAINPGDNPSLQPFTEYYFQVVPVKNGKEGLYSKPLIVRTQPSVPAAPVITGFNYTSVAGEIIVLFDPNWTHSSGILTQFLVYYERDGYQVGTKQGTLRRQKRQSGSVQAGSAAKNVRIAGLSAGERYSFTMLAQNQLDLQSEKSVKKTEQTKTGLPGVPTITDRDGSGRDAILVKWSAPTVTNGEIKGYYVYYRLSNSFNDVAARIVVPPTRLYQNVTGLEEGSDTERTIYEIAVSAFTLAGEGEKSSWEEARTRPKSKPNIMPTPKVNVLDWHTIEVVWELLDDGLTGIDTFTIYLNSQIDGGEGSSYRIPNRNDRYARISTLDEDTSYTLTIVATNWKGSSPKSNQNSFRTPKKPIYLRVWVAGTITGGVVFLLLAFFAFLFFYFLIYKKKPLKDDKKTPIPYIGRDGGDRNPGQRPGTNGSLVLNNPVAGPPQGSERYSSRNSRQDNFRPEDVRMSDLRARQHSDNYSYNSAATNTKPAFKKYYDEGYAPSFADSYDRRYDDSRSYDDRYYGNEERGGYGNDRYGNDRGRERDRYNDNQYDDDRYSSTDNQRTMPRDTVENDGFVIDNPSAARFSQI
ncbi:hypothetical protein ACHWQZ_G001366 [Mnemiopsis leidyi]